MSNSRCWTRDDMNVVDRVPIPTSQSLGSVLQRNCASDDGMNMLAPVWIPGLLITRRHIALAVVGRDFHLSFDTHCGLGSMFAN